MVCGGMSQLLCSINYTSVVSNVKKCFWSLNVIITLLIRADKTGMRVYWLLLVSRIIWGTDYRRNMGRRRNSFHWRDQIRTAYVSSRLLASRGVTVERARWTVTPPPVICAETRCPVSSCLYITACAETACVRPSSPSFLLSSRSQ